jgi:hypothetical protein
MQGNQKKKEHVRMKYTVHENKNKSRHNKRFFSFPNVQTRSGDHPASYSIDTEIPYFQSLFNNVICNVLISWFVI